MSDAPPLRGSVRRGAKARTPTTGSDDPFTRIGGAGLSGSGSLGSLKRAGLGVLAQPAADALPASARCTRSFSPSFLHKIP